MPVRAVRPDDPPLLAGRIHGVRNWSVSGGSAPRLMSMWDTDWVPGGEPTVAMCAESDWSNGDRRAHAAPAHHCRCGLYARHPAHSSQLDLHGGRTAYGQVAGVIEAWGRVELHPDGFRAQFARPVALFVPGFASAPGYRRMVARVAREYEAEVVRVGSRQHLERVCEQRGWGLSPTVIAELAPGEPAFEPDRWAPDWLPGWLERLANGVARGARLIGTGLMLIVLAALWLAQAAVVVGAVVAFVGGIFGWFDSPAPTPPPRPDARLPIVREGVIQAGSRHPYEIAVVGNAHAGQAAVGAHTMLEGRARHARQLKAAIPPGARAVVGAPLRRVSETRLDDRPAAGATAGSLVPSRASPVRGIRAESAPTAGARWGCRLELSVRARTALDRLGVIVLAKEGRAGISDAARYVARDVPRGRSTRVLDRARSCHGNVPRLGVYPDLTPEQVQAR